MEIQQIMLEAKIPGYPQTIFGLGDDNKMYWWDKSTQTWALYI